MRAQLRSCRYFIADGWHGPRSILREGSSLTLQDTRLYALEFDIDDTAMINPVGCGALEMIEPSHTRLSSQVTGGASSALLTNRAGGKARSAVWIGQARL